MSGHKKARYERKQKFLEGLEGSRREMMAMVFDVMHTNKYGTTNIRKKFIQKD